MSAKNTETVSNQNTEATPLQQFDRRLGSNVLSQVSFEKRNKDIVESSFNKALAKKEKLSGNNNERRNLAYLKRLEDIIDYGREDAESRLWNAAAKRLIIAPEQIPSPC